MLVNVLGSDSSLRLVDGVSKDCTKRHGIERERLWGREQVLGQFDNLVLLNRPYLDTKYDKKDLLARRL